MKRWVLIALTVLLPFGAWADDLTTLDGETYRDVTLKKGRSNTTGITISHRKGVARIEYDNMADEDKVKWGYDNKKEREAAERKKREAEEKAGQQAKLEAEKQAAKEALDKAAAAEKEAQQQESVAAKRRAQKEAASGVDGMAVAEFHAAKPTHPVTFTALARLADVYNPESGYGEKENLSVLLEGAKSRESLWWGYIQRTSLKGKDLYELLRDGLQHKIIVKLKYRSKQDDERHFQITDFALSEKEFAKPDQAPDHGGVLGLD